MTTNFGDMVRARRRALGLTLAELSHRAGLSANYLQTVEAGGRDVSLSTIEAVATALGVAPGELTGDVKRLSPIALEGGRLLEALSDDERDAIVRLLRLLVEARAPAVAPRPNPPTPSRKLNPTRKGTRSSTR